MLIMTDIHRPEDGVKVPSPASGFSQGECTDDAAMMKSSVQYKAHDRTDTPSAQVSKPSNVSIAVDPVALVTTECITVTSAMRKHARWAHSSVSAILGGAGAGSDRGSSRLPVQNGTVPGHQKRGSQIGRLRSGALDEDDGLVGHWGRRGKKGKSMQDNPLMSAFARLRSDLRGCTGITQAF